MTQIIHSTKKGIFNLLRKHLILTAILLIAPFSTIANAQAKSDSIWLKVKDNSLFHMFNKLKLKSETFRDTIKKDNSNEPFDIRKVKVAGKKTYDIEYYPHNQTLVFRHIFFDRRNYARVSVTFDIEEDLKEIWKPHELKKIIYATNSKGHPCPIFVFETSILKFIIHRDHGKSELSFMPVSTKDKIF